jgi:hypothetical protein
MYRLKERLAVIEDEVMDEPVYVTTCSGDAWVALYQRLKLRGGPYFRIGWEDGTVTAIHATAIGTRASGHTYAPQELPRVEAVKLVLERAKLLQPTRVQSVGRWKYEYEPVGITQAITGTQSRITQAMERAGLIHGQYVDDQAETIVLLESAYSKTVDEADEVDFP